MGSLKNKRVANKAKPGRQPKKTTTPKKPSADILSEKPRPKPRPRTKTSTPDENTTPPTDVSMLDADILSATEGLLGLASGRHHEVDDGEDTEGRIGHENVDDVEDDNEMSDPKESEDDTPSNGEDNEQDSEGESMNYT
jgi:hypothetical protein